MANEGMNVAKSKEIEVPIVSVQKAKDERKAFNTERAKGESYMHEKRKPFCGACMTSDYQERMKLWEFRKQSGKTNPEPVTVPRWDEYIGDERFEQVDDTITRYWPKDFSMTKETTYKCRKGKHSVCLSESKHWTPADKSS